MPTAAVNGIEVYHERGGEGPPLLFVNGSGATLATSAPLVDVFRARFDTLAHDQRGLGRTTVPAGPYAMADYATDIAALLDHVGWASCRVVGVSFGGMVAQELAVTWPERVERLALLCTSPGGEGGSSYPLHALAELSPAERERVGVTILDTRFDAEWLEAHPDDQALVELMAQRRSGDSGPTVGEALQLEARRHHDVWDRLARIASPTMVAAGRYDGIAPPANAEAIASRIAGAELSLYDGGHAFFVQDRCALPDVCAFLSAG
ncbi:MAG: alpha/beta hydrolase [Actinomycetota bacterium]|nr:alpha/beta hydrolase [Actinomycetota bacterium]